MGTIKPPFLLALIFVITITTIMKTSNGQIIDASFLQYCSRGGKIIKPTVSDTEINPKGALCVITLPIWAKDQDEAKEHCGYWSAYVLRDAKVDQDHIECTFENVYQCKSGYTQISGMCYKDMVQEWKTYDEAKEICKADNAEVFKLHSTHLAVLMDEYMFDLKMYFTQPDDGLEDVIQYSGGSGPNFVVLFDYAHFYHTGSQSIMRFKSEAKAYVMCSYQPPETILSFAYKAKLLGLSYHPTMVSGLVAVWRTASMYTRTTLSLLPDQRDVCEKSMSALTGTKEGTLFNLNPIYSKHLSTDIRDSFVKAFGPFDICHTNRNDYTDFVRTFFKDKSQPNSASCNTRANILEKDYKAAWRKHEDYGDQYSFLFYPTTAGSYDMERKRGAYYGAMLCGIHMIKDTHKWECPDGAITYYRDNGVYVCHKYTYAYKSRDESVSECRNMNGRLGYWTSYNEYSVVSSYRNRFGRDAWVACMDRNGCTSVQSRYGDGGDLRSSLSTWHLDGEQSYICTWNAN